MRISPFIELESVHVSKLSFHVSSWTNLRQSPICVDIEHVTVKILEPLHYIDRRRRRRIRQMTRHELTLLIRQGLVPPPRTGRYNLLDRIIDNLTVEIQSVDVTFQPVGKFKTRRVGLWTPPALRLQLFGVRLVSVTEFGHEASPDEVWRHNHHHHYHRRVGGTGRDGSFLLYKKLETEYKVSIVLCKQQYDKSARKAKREPAMQEGDASTVNSEDVKDEIDSGGIVIPIVSSSLKDGVCDNQSKVQVQFAFQRRIRDGEYLAVQIDTTIPVVQIEILATTVPHLAHFVSAITYLLAKDRAFADPLRSASSMSPSRTQADASPIIVESASSGSLCQSNDEAEVSILDIAMADGLSESSASDDDVDRNEDEKSESQNGDEKSDGQIENIMNDEEGSDVGQNESGLCAGIEGPTVTTAERTVSSPKPAAPHAPVPTPRKPVPQNALTPGRVPQSNDNRPVLVLPNGIILHDKVSISVSVHSVTIRGTYRDSVDGHVQIVANGVVVEAIWPPITQVRTHSGDRSTIDIIIRLAMLTVFFFCSRSTIGEGWLLASFCFVSCDSGAFPAPDTTITYWWRTIR